MASVICDRCGADISMSAALCPKCRAPRPRVRTSRPEQQASSGSEAEPSRTGGRARAETPSGDPACNHQDNPPGRLICQRCNSPIPRRSASTTAEFGLHFPWGEHRLAAGDSLDVGREVPPFAQRLAHDTKISRRHATFTATSTALLVRDNGSLNGTRCNGADVSATDFELREGDRVELSSQLIVIIGRRYP